MEKSDALIRSGIINTKLTTNKTTVSRIVKRWNQTHTLANLSKSGRSLIMDQEQVELLDQVIKANKVTMVKRYEIELHK